MSKDSKTPEGKVLAIKDGKSIFIGEEAAKNPIAMKRNKMQLADPKAEKVRKSGADKTLKQVEKELSGEATTEQILAGARAEGEKIIAAAKAQGEAIIDAIEKRAEKISSNGQEAKVEKSIGDTVVVASAKIDKLETVEDVDAFVSGDERAGVKKAAQERIEELNK